MPIRRLLTYAKGIIVALSIGCISAVTISGLTLPSFFLSGCAELSSSSFNSTNVVELRNALIGKGTIKIDASNPYLAAGQLLNSEKNVSQSLTGFISIRGEPSAVEVEKDKSSKLTLKLYYTDLFERYELTATDADWVIAGPFPDQSIPRALNETPTATSSKLQETPTPTTAIKYWGSTPTFTPVSTPTVFSEPIVTVIPAAESTNTPTSQNLAEVSPRGDVVHYVTLQGETISIIARWYTGERNNASKIARLNRMKNADTLQIGDSIVIPSYMVKNKYRLTDTDLANVKKSITTELSQVQTSEQKISQ